MQLSTADADAVENVINNRILQLFALHYTLFYSQENIGNIKFLNRIGCEVGPVF